MSVLSKGSALTAAESSGRALIFFGSSCADANVDRIDIRIEIRNKARNIALNSKSSCPLGHSHFETFIDDANILKLTLVKLPCSIFMKRNLSIVFILLLSSSTLIAQRELGVRPTATGGPLKFEEAVYDVQSYDVTLNVDPKTKSISG